MGSAAAMYSSEEIHDCDWSLKIWMMSHMRVPAVNSRLSGSISMDMQISNCLLSDENKITIEVEDNVYRYSKNDCCSCSR